MYEYMVILKQKGNKSTKSILVMADNNEDAKLQAYHHIKDDPEFNGWIPRMATKH